MMGGIVSERPVKRTVHIMTRLSQATVDAIDAVISLEVFRSRSEAVAAYVENAIDTKTELYSSLINKAKEVKAIRNSARDSILDSIHEDEETDT
jgi:metal-responsive CopG/Arc/MetJ family transcriptional regulator